MKANSLYSKTMQISPQLFILEGNEAFSKTFSLKEPLHLFISELKGDILFTSLNEQILIGNCHW